MRPFPPPPAWHREITTVGVTGTNGKTSTTTFVAAALGALGSPVARITTLGRHIDDEALALEPGYAGFIEALRLARARGATHAAIEYTSEALGIGFARAWPPAVGIFTNLTRDHLDAHGSAEHYLACKAQLFVALPEGGAAVLNACDASGALLAEILPAGRRVRTFAVASRGAAWTAPSVEATRVELDWSGTRMDLAYGAGVRGPAVLSTRAIGEVYAEDALAALVGAIEAGAPADDAARAIAACPPPPGRFEVVAERPWVVVDYAHSPDALARVVATARLLADRTAGCVAIVFGAGGDRDRGKRPQMGEVAASADGVVLTTDNPRSEDPAAIAREIRAGIPPGSAADVRVELDRRRAIETAVRGAGPNDVVVVAGKGHEASQVSEGAAQPFSDAEAALSAHHLR
jgi:UDP-N-acetylmuramoyl-L-alanyl-D-glutamate--2,6-diaminopimelate ligase